MLNLDEVISLISMNNVINDYFVQTVLQTSPSPFLTQLIEYTISQPLKHSTMETFQFV